jgi:galactokinase
MITAFGPGRVNLIGEHTDYNDGLAMPFAIERGVTVTAEPARHFTVHARDLGETDEFDEPEPADGWRAFARGMVAELRNAGHDVEPARLTIQGDLAQGSGLSSSAALETALALALLGEAPQDLKALAKLCSKVENQWVGAETGLLDQFASLLSRPGHALRIDFRSLDARPVPLDLGDWQLVTVESGATHTHAASGYNQRRAECRAACETLGVATLRDATTLDGLPDTLQRRVRHVLTENERVDAMAEALVRGDQHPAAQIHNASPASRSHDNAGTGPPVERTVQRLKDEGAAGARMVGGGFGGSVLALLPPGAGRPGGALPVVPSGPARLL